ncbi:hypothetical protein ACOBQX_08585 [Actinokineospora sp. G85]|uniref:hypothetical protein n=1 Tax=Actinokineospora sp. G85 TaxID=3406626 RepID=UPI003C73CEF9
MSDAVDRLLDAWGDYIVALRSNEGFKEDLYDRLFSVLRECEREWRDTEAIPKPGVNVLVDIVSVSQAVADSYPEPVRQRIYDASFELYDQIIECVTTAPS